MLDAWMPRWRCVDDEMASVPLALDMTKTKRLAETAKKSKKVKVWIDGPYGFSPNLKTDDTVVFVAGTHAA